MEEAERVWPKCRECGNYLDAGLQRGAVCHACVSNGTLPRERGIIRLDQVRGK